MNIHSKKQHVTRFEKSSKAASVTMPIPRVYRMDAETNAAATDEDDDWAFLEHIDAPKWVDFSLEATRERREGDDQWFYQNHNYHEAYLEDMANSLPLKTKKTPFRKSSKGWQNQRSPKIVDANHSQPQTRTYTDPHKRTGHCSTERHGELNHLERGQAWSGSRSKRVQLQPNQQISLSMQRVSTSSMSSSFLKEKENHNLEFTSPISSSSLMRKHRAQNEGLEQAQLQARVSEICTLMYKEAGKEHNIVSEVTIKPHHQQQEYMRSKPRPNTEEEISLYLAKQAREKVRVSKHFTEQDGKGVSTNHCSLDSIKSQNYSKHRLTSGSLIGKVQECKLLASPPKEGGRETLNRQKRSLSQGTTDENTANMHSVPPVKPKSLSVDRAKKSRRTRTSLFNFCKNNDVVESEKIKTHLSQVRVPGLFCSKTKVASNATTQLTSQSSKAIAHVKHENQLKAAISEDKQLLKRASIKASISPFQSLNRADVLYQRRSDDAIAREANRRMRRERASSTYFATHVVDHLTTKSDSVETYGLRQLYLADDCKGVTRML